MSVHKRRNFQQRSSYKWKESPANVQVMRDSLEAEKIYRHWQANGEYRWAQEWSSYAAHLRREATLGPIKKGQLDKYERPQNLNKTSYFKK